MACIPTPGSALAIALTLLLAVPVHGTAADEIKIGGTGAGLGTMRLLADAFARQVPEVNVSVPPSLGSSGGIRAVVGGALDIAVSSRPLKEDERKLGATEIEYGRTPFVFAVASKSKVTAITNGQLADIYAGRLVNWPDGTRIRLVLRPAGESDTAQVKSMSPDIGRVRVERCAEADLPRLIACDPDNQHIVWGTGKILAGEGCAAAGIDHTRGCALEVERAAIRRSDVASHARIHMLEAQPQIAKWQIRLGEGPLQLLGGLIGIRIRIGLDQAAHLG